jgi:hypothetical protein
LLCRSFIVDAWSYNIIHVRPTCRSCTARKP